MAKPAHSSRPGYLVRLLRLGLIGGVLILLLIQLVPYGREHTNPPVRAEPVWDSPRTRELAVAACFDCHSNQTVWPWYSNLAPASWLLQRDVDEGRKKLNYSEWDRPQEESDESAETVQDGEMPPWFYLPLHPEARLSQADREALVSGLLATFGGEAEGAEDEEDDD